MRKTAKFPRGATRKGAPCKHCGSEDKYLSSRRCVNFYNIKGHGDMVYVPPVLPPATEQQCRTCNEVKPLSSFHIRSDSGKYRTECKECKSIAQSCTTYGITVTHYRALLENQNHSCAICKTHEDDLDHATFTRLVVDHNHTTGKVRGLLCSTCNAGLGHFHDSTLKLLTAVDYINANN